MDDLTPRVRSQADLDALWRHLMGPLGFAYARLYVVYVPPDGHCVPHLTEVSDLPVVPDRPLIDNLMRVCGSVLEQLPEGSRVAFLHARPGERGISATDRTWAVALLAAARRAGVPVWPVHLANDHELRVVAPDDLAETA